MPQDGVWWLWAEGLVLFAWDLGVGSCFLESRTLSFNPAVSGHTMGDPLRLG